MPSEGITLKPRAELLTFDEIETLATVFVKLGIEKIRITGGEPLVRNGVEKLCERITAISGLKTLAITTNGVLLEEKAHQLKNAGIQNINISLDTLQPERFERVALRGEFERVIRGIESALQAGFSSIKINVVVMRNFNDDELSDFVEFAQVLSLNVRFIEYMPFLGNGWNEVQFVSYKEMKESITAQHELIPLASDEALPGPAKEFRIGESNATVGFITTMSEHFCGECNRLRLTADGKMRNCLFAAGEIDLKQALRSGASEKELSSLIHRCVMKKWEKHPDAQELVVQQNRAMIAIGG
jgi:cyclic pyranopterin phosphate synthase